MSTAIFVKEFNYVYKIEDVETDRRASYRGFIGGSNDN